MYIKFNDTYLMICILTVIAQVDGRKCQRHISSASQISQSRWPPIFFNPTPAPRGQSPWTSSEGQRTHTYSFTLSIPSTGQKHRLGWWSQKKISLYNSCSEAQITYEELPDMCLFTNVTLAQSTESGTICSKDDPWEDRCLCWEMRRKIGIAM